MNNDWILDRHIKSESELYYSEALGMELSLSYSVSASPIDSKEKRDSESLQYLKSIKQQVSKFISHFEKNFSEILQEIADRCDGNTKKFRTEVVRRFKPHSVCCEVDLKIDSIVDELPVYRAYREIVVLSEFDKRTTIIVYFNYNDFSLFSAGFEGD